MYHLTSPDPSLHSNSTVCSRSLYKVEEVEEVEGAEEKEEAVVGEDNQLKDNLCNQSK